jgi:hypothetical protein
MDKNELEVLDLMQSIKDRYFPDLDGIQFEIAKDTDLDGVYGRAVFGEMRVILYYSDGRILQPRYRMGLVPIVSHELSHFLDPVNPERVMRERLPREMTVLWEELVAEGHAICSMEAQH